MKKQTAYLIFSLLLITGSLLGQKQNKEISTTTQTHSTTPQTNFSTQRDLLLENDSKAKEVKINVPQHIKKLNISINSSVNKGKIKIELYNPKGVLKGSFVIETQVSSAKREIARGNIRKHLTEPQAGEWKVKIIPTTATGRIAIRSVTVE